MPATGRSVFIAGAGIAGLTLALALAKFGVRVVVLERHPKIQEYGAGLQISPNARRVLNHLGLDQAIAEASFEPQGIDIVPFGARRPLTTLRLGPAIAQKFGAPYAVMHRADLAEALFRATRRFANIDIAFDVPAFAATSTETGVRVALDSTDGRPDHAAAFAFVGADGIHSATRAALQGPAPEWTGAVAWRTLIPSEALAGVIALDRTTLLFGPDYHAVCYPLPHRGEVNVALFAPDRETGEPDRERPLLPGAERSEQFAAILHLAARRWGYWPVGVVNAPHWHAGNIGLIGDAAHAMLPFQAQGAAMAIEDAAILAPLLATEVSAEVAFRRFEALRHSRVKRVAATAIGNGRAFHMVPPLSFARDLVIRAQGPRGHLRRLTWLYGYDALADARRGVPDLPA